MKLSEKLFLSTKELWDLSTEKPFVIEMAKGTLIDQKFRNYTLQDYLYLLDYAEILRSMKALSTDAGLTEFLDRIIYETLQETERVHLPNIKKIGIKDDEIVRSNEIKAISDYVAFMEKCIDEEGLPGGLTALLQCSWVYAYISENVMLKYPAEVASSKYRFWFEAYSCKSYLDANQMWIDTLDKQLDGLDEKETERLCRIFKQCAIYENELWDALWDVI